MVKRLFPYLLALFVPLAIYSPSLNFTFVYDDAELVVRKLPPDSLRAWKELLSSAYFEGLPYYRPIPALLFGIERSFFGLNPTPYHWTNFFLIGFLSLAILALFRRSFFGFSTSQAVVLTLLTVLHPVTSSSVYLLSGREALLAALFAVCAIDRLIRSRGRFDWSTYLWIVLALLSRESSIWLLPFTMGVIVINRNRFTRMQSMVDGARLFLLLLAYGLLRFFALAGEAPTPMLNPDPLSIPASFLYAFKGILMPTLTVHYEPLLSEWLSVEFLAATACALSLIAGISRHVGVFRERTPRALLTVLCISLLPTANIFIQETPFDERHLVLPLIVATTLFGWIMNRLPNLKSSYSLIVTALIASSLALISFSRHTVFVSDEAFLDHWYHTAPEQAKVNVYQIVRALVLHDWQQATLFANRSIELQENNLALLYRARVHLALGDLRLADHDLDRSALLDGQNPDVLCERLLLARARADTSKASTLLQESQSQDKPLWCLTVDERRSAPKYWTEGLDLSEAELQKLPLFNREEWRRVQEVFKLRQD